MFEIINIDLHIKSVFKKNLIYFSIFEDEKQKKLNLVKFEQEAVGDF